MVNILSAFTARLKQLARAALCIRATPQIPGDEEFTCRGPSSYKIEGSLSSAITTSGTVPQSSIGVSHNTLPSTYSTVSTSNTLPFAPPTSPTDSYNPDAHIPAEVLRHPSWDRSVLDFIEVSTTPPRSPSPTSTVERLSLATGSEFSFDTRDKKYEHGLLNGGDIDTRRAIWIVDSVHDEGHLVDTEDIIQFGAHINNHLCHGFGMLLDPVRTAGPDYIIFIASIFSPFTRVSLDGTCTPPTQDIQDRLVRHRKAFAFNHAPPYACGLVPVMVARSIMKMGRPNNLVDNTAVPSDYALLDCQPIVDPLQGLCQTVRATAALFVDQSLPEAAEFYSVSFHAHIWGNIIRAHPFYTHSYPDDEEYDDTTSSARGPWYN